MFIFANPAPRPLPRAALLNEELSACPHTLRHPHAVGCGRPRPADLPTQPGR